MNLAVLCRLNVAQDTASQALWRHSDESSWRLLAGPATSSPTFYEIALALKRQLAEGGIDVSLGTGDDGSDVSIRLRSGRAFDLVVPPNSGFAALGLAPSILNATEVSNERTPLGACFGLCVARWERTKPPVRARCRFSPTGLVLGGEATGNQAPLSLRLAALSALRLERLNELLGIALLDDTPLTLFGLSLANGAWSVNENESWRVSPNLDAALRVTRRLVTTAGEAFDVTLMMEVAA